MSITGVTKALRLTEGNFFCNSAGKSIGKPGCKPLIACGLNKTITDPVNVSPVFMETVITQFHPGIHIDQDTTGDPESQSEYIDQ